MCHPRCAFKLHGEVNSDKFNNDTAFCVRCVFCGLRFYESVRSQQQIVRPNRFWGKSEVCHPRCAFKLYGYVNSDKFNNDTAFCGTCVFCGPRVFESVRSQQQIIRPNRFWGNSEVCHSRCAFKLYGEVNSVKFNNDIAFCVRCVFCGLRFYESVRSQQQIVRPNRFWGNSEVCHPRCAFKPYGEVYSVKKTTIKYG